MFERKCFLFYFGNCRCVGNVRGFPGSRSSARRLVLTVVGNSDTVLASLASINFVSTVLSQGILLGFDWW